MSVMFLKRTSKTRNAEQHVTLFLLCGVCQTVLSSKSCCELEKLNDNCLVARNS